jgi:glucans biosynthesis protein
VDEFNDNIVAFWEPKKQLAAGQSSEFAYEIQWFSENAKLPEVGRAVSTRIADIADPEDKDRVADGKTVIRKFVLDFRWPEVSEDVASTNLLTASVDVQNATLLGKPVQQYNPYDRTWRLFFKASAPKDGSPVECRAFISRNAKPVTETWIYLWNP